jgi:hypothetical protein
MPHSTNGTFMLPLLKRLESPNMRLLHQGTVDKWQVDGKEQPSFLHTFVTPLAILVTFPAGSHTLAKDTKAATTSQSLVQEESHWKESLKRSPMVTNLDSDVIQYICSLSLRCTLVGQP